ncbi:di-trans,poly-cis-decaprenylcistransferase [Plasmodium falciparum Santa Lucia]|uniref:Alkyl transferase n=6 Tax=Plasmodium falciparum TaxID=5833 RepID=Q8IB97_PLAF7|nr:dehydrodolichyl diphosphate synthetase, putative [Plasmodium falciparum 3D7]ETW52394.1 di-trans,poly-cis-decaprenylcistransferase [Plasmodium falciparum Palo Alto/Uganda]ETW62069.1 di-trans,poly-cis-decaprenylcistransferase [Plasmodium falciparum CAMP/Malaysia]EUT87338.1 di-trans,poly-cis-decaprenylcistransferase [Plasmodium falciparum Santa Lucia]KAF4330433.1 dehydrodolichyl diphosphate synthetase [Plasmodium falciparum NF54]PKC47589.1 dehydrodolichyl diphosphate synthetase [Plasmodium fal|eukprot:XP_001349261.2 dehydrodolichyl diphosphate synthetase,putative [Plasmodium falciparum 3D7]
MALNIIERFVTYVLRDRINIKHISIIMDGNRRFAKEKGLHTAIGHFMGSKTLIQIIEICIKLNIKILSVFSFSLLNYNRSPEEIHFLFYLNLLVLINEDFFFKFIKDNKIKIKIIGNLSYVNDSYRKIIYDIEEKTKNFNNIRLNIFFSYTSRNEMSLCSFNPNLYRDTYKNLLQEKNIYSGTNILTDPIKEGYFDIPTQEEELKYPDHENENELKFDGKCLCREKVKYNEEQLEIVNYHNKLLTSDLPPPNILIRTSGEQRLSDFMLYQISEFTEIYFINEYWPVFNFLQFIYIILHYTLFQTTKWIFSYSNPCPH